MVALLSVPTSALAANKVGGEDNSFHAMYYLLAGVSLLLVQRAQAGRIACHAFAVLVLSLAGWSGTIDPRQPDPDFAASSTQQAFDYARRHPGEGFFPWQPLAALFAERRVDHFDYALYDREIAGFAPSDEHLRAYLPPHMRFLAVRGSEMFAVGPLLGEFAAAGRMAELPGWSIFARPDATPAGFEFVHRVRRTPTAPRGWAGEHNPH